MKKLASVLLNLVLFVILSFAVSVVAVLLMSYVDIIFTVSVESSWAVYGVAAVAFLVSVYLYFIFIKNKSGALTGSALAGASGAGAGLKSLFVYIIIIGGAVACYVIAVLINSHVFGAMAEKEKAALAQYGVTSEWKSFFPDMDYKDPENAAPHIEAAGKLFTDADDKEVTRLWDMVTGEKEYDRVKAMDDIKKLSEKTAKPMEALEKAVGYKKFLWDDIKAKDGRYGHSSVRIPQFSTFKRFSRIEMLEAMRAANGGNWTEAGTRISKIIAITDMLEQDPWLVSYLIRVADMKIIYNGLVSIAKNAKDKKAALEFARKVSGDIRPMKDSFSRAMGAEFSGMVALSEALNTGVILEESFVSSGGWTEKYATLAYYRAFGKWDAYVFMRGAGLIMPGASERDLVKRKADNEMVDKFFAEHTALPALFATIGTPAFSPYFKRELQAEAERDIALLFASALVYKAKHGKYPETLDKLAPEYMSVIPKNPLKNAPYVYKTSGEYMEIIAEPDGEDKPIIAIIGERPKQQ
ncbi:MAG: hypothetical protein OEV59_02885 [Deltaproteobacteria bacterium]|nr:hypothetical protein [Deltaproteobacteria bacterium]